MLLCVTPCSVAHWRGAFSVLIRARIVSKEKVEDVTAYVHSQSYTPSPPGHHLHEFDMRLLQV